MEGFTNSVLVKNSDLTLEQYRLLEAAILKSARRETVARMIYGSFAPLGNKRQLSYNLLAEMSGGVISYGLETTQDRMKVALNNLQVPVIQKQFWLDRLDLEASRTEGTPIDTLNAEGAGYQIAIKEEDMLLDGWTNDGTNYKVNGMYQAAGNTEATGADFGTAGKGPLKAGLAMGVLMIDNINPPYNWVLHPTQYGQLFQYTAGHSLTNFQEVKDIIGGEIFASTSMTAGQGLMVATPDRGYFKAYEGPSVTEYWRDPDNIGTFGRVFKPTIPRIHETNSICTMTGI